MDHKQKFQVTDEQNYDESIVDYIGETLREKGIILTNHQSFCKFVRLFYRQLFPLAIAIATVYIKYVK